MVPTFDAYAPNSGRHDDREDRGEPTRKAAKRPFGGGGEKARHETQRRRYAVACDEARREIREALRAY